MATAMVQAAMAAPATAQGLQRLGRIVQKALFRVMSTSAECDEGRTVIRHVTLLHIITYTLSAKHNKCGCRADGASHVFVRGAIIHPPRETSSVFFPVH